MKKFVTLTFWITLLAFSHQSLANKPLSPLPSKTVECSVGGDSDLIYSRFFNLWSEDTGIKEGNPTRKIRNMSPSEQAEAVDCLKKADWFNNCGAIHVLELFYRSGVFEKKLGIRKDLGLADKYLERKKAICSQSSTPHLSSAAR